MRRLRCEVTKESSCSHQRSARNRRGFCCPATTGLKECVEYQYNTLFFSGFFGHGTTRQRPLATGCAQTRDTFINLDDMNQHATDVRGHTHEHTRLQCTCHTLRQQTNGFFYIRVLHVSLNDTTVDLPTEMQILSLNVQKTDTRH